MVMSIQIVNTYFALKFIEDKTLQTKLIIFEDCSSINRKLLYQTEGRWQRQVEKKVEAKLNVIKTISRRGMF